MSRGPCEGRSSCRYPENDGVVFQDLTQKLLAEMIVLRDDDTFT